MNIIPIFYDFTNIFNEKMSTNINPLNLEQKIIETGDDFTLKLYEDYLSFLDRCFKYSTDRLEKYIVKETTLKTLTSSIGNITFTSTRYIDRETKKSYYPIRDILNLKAYQRMTNEAEHTITKYAMENNMSQAAKHALRNTPISRSTVSKKVAKLNGSIKEDIKKSTNQPDVLYIEIDEIHANLQHGGNQICPCAIVHEGYKEDFVKRKELKNIHYFASAKLSYEELAEVIYDYIDKKYDIYKFKRIFVSGDGLIASKKLNDIFPNSKFVFDPFHYRRKHLGYIFKNNKILINMADSYIKNNQLDEFNELVKIQIRDYPEQENKIREHAKCIIKNIEYIQNQNDELYKCPCSMEGHVNHGFARYITSSPFGFSLNGLNNKLKLLVYKANKVDLTIEDYMSLKYGKDSYIEINKNINKLLNVKIDKSLLNKKDIETNINIKMSFLSSGNNLFKTMKNLISIDNNIRFI